MNPSQLLTFTLGRESYAVDILKVQEIKACPDLTPIPNAPSCVKGVMDLRGTVVPVIGLRERFGLETVDYDRFTVVVVLRLKSRVVGVVVDAVADVIKPGALEPAPELGPTVDTSAILGMAKTAERLIVVLDVDRVAADAIGDLSAALLASEEVRASA